MSDEQFIDQVDRPEDVVDDEQDNGMVVMPAYQERVDTQDTVDDA